MKSFLLKRLAMLVPTLLGSATLVFLILEFTPGDPARIMLGPRANARAVAAIRHELRLDQPFLQRYSTFIGNLLQGDLGRSIRSKKPVIEEIASYLPATIELSLAALFWATVLGVLLGILAATRRNSWLDYTTMSTALVGVSMPIFWLGLVLMLLFSVALGWFPSGGRLDARLFLANPSGFYLWDGLLIWLRQGDARYLLSALHHLVLPAVALGTIPLAVIARVMRSSMLESLGQDYIRTAKATGLAPRLVVYRYALKNALLPVITVVGLQFGVLLSGAVLTETIFSWPGLGKWIYLAIEQRDYPAIQGGVLLISLIFVSINLVTDVLYAMVNPKIRVS